jgi:hypothetical protein
MVSWCSIDGVGIGGEWIREATMNGSDGKPCIYDGRNVSETEYRLFRFAKPVRTFSYILLTPLERSCHFLAGPDRRYDTNSQDVQYLNNLDNIQEREWGDIGEGGEKAKGGRSQWGYTRDQCNRPLGRKDQ